MNSEIGVDEAVHEAMRTLVHRLYVAARTVASYGERHPHSVQAALDVAEAFRAANPPYAVQFVGDAIFRDFKLIPVGFDIFQNGQQLGAAMKALGAREIRVDHAPEADDLMPFLSALGHGFSGSADPIELIRVPGLAWRDIAGALWGEAGERVDPEVFVLGQIALALDTAERLALDKEAPCDWPVAFGAVRRLEQAMETNTPATLRALELAPGEWTPARRAVSSAILALAVMRHIGATAYLARAAAHAALALGLFGYRPRGGVPLVDAAYAATRMFFAPAASRLGAEPHRLRVSMLVDRIARYPEERDAWLPPSLLVEITYEMERRRCPDGAAFDLGLVDLLAMVIEEAGRPFDARWVRALVGTVGVVPPGARVQLADGREAVAVEPGTSGDPRRPVVLVDGQLVVPERAVTVLAGPATRV